MLATFASLALERSTYSLEVPPQKGYVNDLASLLPRDYALDLDERLRRFEHQTDHKILILTITSLGGEDIKSFGRKLFTDWQLEVPSKVVFLVIAKNEQKVLIESSAVLEQVLSDPTTIRRVEGAVVSYLGGYKPEVGVEYGLESLVKRINTGHSLGLPARQTAFWNVGGQGFNDRRDGTPYDSCVRAWSAFGGSIPDGKTTTIREIGFMWRLGQHCRSRCWSNSQCV